MWVIQFNVLRGGERSPEDGSPREFLNPGSPFPLPDIDQTVLHRGEAFVVDDVVWDLERKTVTVELVPPYEVAQGSDKKSAAGIVLDDDDDDFEDLGALNGETGDGGLADDDENDLIDEEPRGDSEMPEAPLASKG